MTEPSHLAALLAAACAVRDRAYAPYSGYAVGAAVLSDDGQIFVGCNVENAAYPVGTCAEAGALAALVAGGGRRINALVVVASGVELVAPCGACRQRIREFAADDAPIHMAGPDGVRRTCRVADLLPLAFGPASLRQTAEETRA